jgi:hypothetical protein
LKGVNKKSKNKGFCFIKYLNKANVEQALSISLHLFKGKILTCQRVKKSKEGLKLTYKENRENEMYQKFKNIKEANQLVDHKRDAIKQTCCVLSHANKNSSNTNVYMGKAYEEILLYGPAKPMLTFSIVIKRYSPY